MSTAPFVERHRPEDLESVVLPQDIKDRLIAFAKTGDLPQSCIFYGEPGVGKTTSALALAKAYYVQREIYPPDTTLEQIRAEPPRARLLVGTFYPSLFVASRTQGTIDFIKGIFTRFLKGAPPVQGLLKLAIFDEADGMSKDAKEALLPLIEQYPTTRIIFTTNMEPIFGLGPAIVSRAAGCTFEFVKPSKQEVIAHLKKIAEKEGVALNEESFNSIADTAKDVREAVGMLGSDIALVRAKKAPKIVPLMPEKPSPQLVPVLRSDLQNFLKSLEEFRSRFFTRLRPENRRAGFLDLDNEFEMLFFRWRDSFAGRMKNLEFHRANEPENIRFLGYDLITEEFKTVRANFLRDPQRGLERLDTAIDYLREIIEGKWMPVPSKLEEALQAREEEEKPKIEAVPFMAGAKIYYYASYNRPYSVIEIRDQIDGGTLVRPKEKIEFGEPFAIIQRDEPLPEKAIKSLELKQISADKIPPWWATAVRTEIPRFPQRPKEFPPIPKAGITEEWVEEVLSIDPYVKPEVERKRPGEYDIIYYKNINGEDMVLSMQTGLPFKLTRDTLLEGNMNRMKWNGKDVTIPAGWEDDEERFEKTYTRSDLTALTQNQLRDVARIKGINMTGTYSEIVDRILGVPPKEAPPPPTPAPTPPTPIPSRMKEEAKPTPPPPPPRRARITDADAKTLEEAFRAEMALRGIPLKSSTTDYLAVFKAYLREATTKGVSPDRFKSNWLPNVVSSIEEVYSNRTQVSTQEVTRRIKNVDAKFKPGSYVEYQGELKEVEAVTLNGETGTYEYRLKGVGETIDELQLKPANVPAPKFALGDNVVRANRGYLVTDIVLDTGTRKYKYRLREIKTRTGEMP